MSDTGGSVSELSAKAREASAKAAESAEIAEGERRLDPDTAKSLVEAGFARHFVPRRHGGAQGGFAELTPAVAALGEGCAAAAWCAALLANLGRMAGYLPDDGQAEVWADGPDAAVVGSLIPSGTAEPTRTGWRLSGRWPYISGIDFADWVLLAARVPGGDRSSARLFAVPRSVCQVLDTWHTVGMRATGSNTVTTEDVFVPASRSFARDELFHGRAAESVGQPYEVPLQAVNGLSFVTPALGAARGTLEAWRSGVEHRLRNAVPGAPGLSRNTYEVTIAQAAAEIDSSALLLDRVSQQGDRGGALTELEISRNQRDCAFAVNTLASAVDRMFRTAGTSAQSSTNPIQRFWRDTHSAASHVALLFEPAAKEYARHVLRLPEC